jgi:hypothetical protein
MPGVLATDTAFAVFGALVMFTNLLVLITFISSGKLIKKYVLLIALSLADMTAGGAAFSSGYGRLLVYEQVPAPNYTVSKPAFS